jgi:hypothetical protein
LGLIEKAAAEGARLVVFPEAFLPVWPAWVDEVLPGEDAAWHVRLLEQSVVVPGPVAYLPGTEGGSAVADVPFGKVNPSGHLPVSWPSEATRNPPLSQFDPGGAVAAGRPAQVLRPAAGHQLRPGVGVQPALPVRLRAPTPPSRPAGCPPPAASRGAAR